MSAKQHPLRLSLLIALAMLAFAGNSLLCRAALAGTTIDPAAFTALRLFSGALTLWLLVLMHQRQWRPGGNYRSALALFAYAAAFSFAYTHLSAATGALLLFGAVQTTMIGFALWQGARFNGLQTLGVGCALAGLVGLLLPGLSAPPLLQGLLMVSAGVAWGIYSLRGRGATNATGDTAGNFVRALPMALLLCLLWRDQLQWDLPGAGYAIASGALASGLGYAIWYAVLPSLQAATAATLQLSVPVITAVLGVLLLDEPLSLRLLLASIAILGGVALFIWQGRVVAAQR
ncbi:DMT family transporter [Pseudomaricurvus sp. HS19]|uniref:DMT family transporter n=1 Tax=Pseudomaricurvus sp. HS19 TaxID=2692626 RepID=UPI001369C2FE|nr:DMT family transporter [Pseudomaricurvus sp. HS19]MYM64108.1 EamA family transporter [Pseudomaricurvus sp. HS19]